jgi:hypothetical protein
VKFFRNIAGVTVLALNLTALTPIGGLTAASDYTGSGELKLKKIAGYTTGAEIVQYDKLTQQVFLINGSISGIEVVNLSRLQGSSPTRATYETLTVGQSQKVLLKELTGAGITTGLFGDVTRVAVHQRKI